MIPTYYDAPDIFEGSVPMRGDDQQTGWMFSYLSPEERVPADHPRRAIRRMTEPFSSLDRDLRVDLRGELASLRRQLQITAISVTHDPQDAEALADRTIAITRSAAQ